MATLADPIPGNWYKDVENSLLFKIIIIDEKADSIEVQYLNGDIGEYDYDSWYNSTFDNIEEPEDWTAPYDEVESDDRGYTDPDQHRPTLKNIDIDDYLDN